MPKANDESKTTEERKKKKTVRMCFPSSGSCLKPGSPKHSAYLYVFIMCESEYTLYGVANFLFLGHWGIDCNFFNCCIYTADWTAWCTFAGTSTGWRETDVYISYSYGCDGFVRVTRVTHTHTAGEAEMLRTPGTNGTGNFSIASSMAYICKYMFDS